MKAHSLRVLLVEDDDDHARLIADQVAEARVNGGTTFDRASSVPEALLKAGAERYDIFLIDYPLGADDGESFLRQVRSKGIDTPAILLTNQESEELAVEAMEQGAADQLRKSQLDAAALGAAIRYAVELHRSRTSQMQAEAALRESEARYRRVFDQALTGNVITTPGGRILACNAAFARILGFDSVEEALGARAYALYPDIESRERLLDRLRASGALDHFEAELRRRDGTPIHVLLNAVAVRDRAGSLVELQGSILDITERKRTQEALQAKTQELDRYFTSSLDLLCIADTQGFFRRLNPEWEALLGWPLAELEGHRFLDFVHPDDLPSTLAAVAQLSSQREVLGFVNRYLCKDGSYRWLEWRSYAEGERIYAVARDITKRLRAEKELAESNRFNAEIIASVHQVLFACDRDLRYVLWNRFAEESSGIAAKDVIGRRVLDIFPSLGDQGVEALLQRALAGETVTTPDIPVEVPGGGTIVWTTGTLVPRRDAEGRTIGVIGSVHDITERKQGEEALRKLTRAVEQSPAAILITDAAGRIEYVNPKFTAATGFAADEAIGQTARMLKSGKTPAGFYAQMWRTILSGREWSGEILNRAKDGQLRWFSTRISPLRGGDGRITHFVAVQEDISERRSLEEQLRQSQKMEAVGQLAGGVAHDFNNLLGVILGYADLLLRGAEPEHPATRRLEQIHQAAERATGLTRQLLAFSRKQVLDPKVVSLNSIVGDTEKMLRRLIGEDVEVRVSLDSGLGLVKADPGQLEQVLMNLAVNARDAMPQGGRLVIETVNVVLDAAHAEGHVGAPTGPCVMLAVSDTGVGMDADTRSRIFEPFFTTKELGKGTGLGLSTVYGIVRQSGGHVTVSSEPGMGSSFKVYLPRVEDEATPSRSAAARGPISAGTETILLVEDEASLRAMIAETLGNAGYTVIEAANPAEALALAEGRPNPADLLLTDVVMPGTNGRDLADAIARAWPGIRFLFMSGYTDEAVVRHGVLDPGIAFIGKPFTADALARKVREALGGD
ncbi:MAG: PAS domain S-box protein [Vicinamibacteria bacterium]